MCLTRTKTIKRKLNKCRNIFYSYNDIQLNYGILLDNGDEIEEIKSNIKLNDFILGDNYTTDFYCVKKDGTILIRECVFKDKLLKPMTIKLLDSSRNYWLSRGIIDRGIVLNIEK